MRRLPGWLKVPVVALAATALGFPFLSIEGDGPAARITGRALWVGGTFLVLGYLWLGLRLLLRLPESRVVRWLGRHLGRVPPLRWAGRGLRRCGRGVGGSLAGGARAVARTARRRETLLALAAALALLAVLFPFVMPRQHVNLAFETLVYMTLALGLNVIVGYGGLLVLGYAAFWAIGAYTFALLALRLGVNMWVSLPAAGLTAMLAGVLVGLPSLRLRGDYLAIVTLGFGELVYYFLKTEVSLTGGEMGLPNKDIRGSLQDHTGLLGWGPFFEPHHFYWPALGLVVLAIYVIRRVERSRVGRALVAMREDETAARCMGIDTTRLKLAAFAFAAMWAGFAGVLWAAKQDYTNPRYYDFIQSVMILAMVVLGGMGSIPGAMLGAVLLYAGPALLRTYNEPIRELTGIPDVQEYRLLAFGAIMVALMVFRPQGLLGSARLRVQMKGEGDEP